MCRLGEELKSGKMMANRGFELKSKNFTTVTFGSNFKGLAPVLSVFPGHY